MQTVTTCSLVQNPLIWRKRLGFEKRSKYATFELRQAKMEDAEAIIKLVNTSYFHKTEKFDCAYYRNKKYEGQLGKTDIPRRIATPSDYTVYVCVKKGHKSEQDVLVGTIYLQFQNSDYKGKAEVGQLAVHPEWQKKFDISKKMLQMVEKEALQRNERCLYLYLVGPINQQNQNGLQRFYEKQGYTEVERKNSKPSQLYVTPETPDGISPRIVMNKVLVS